jgi:hypothetical protein
MKESPVEELSERAAEKVADKTERTRKFPVRGFSGSSAKAQVWGERTDNRTAKDIPQGFELDSGNSDSE